MYSKRSSFCALTTIAAGVAFLSTSPLSAQVLEEVVVTARKVEENLQQTPVTANVLNSEAMARYGIDDIGKLADRVPNLTIRKGGTGAGAGEIRLRGVGSSSISAAFDSAVALNLDGVQSNNGRMLMHGMFDLEQVEVLKGPQSLYFGKSASAGVFSLTSKNPTEVFEAGMSAAYEFEEEGTVMEGFVSGPLTETLGARLAIRWSETDKLFENTASQAVVGGIVGGPPYLTPSTGKPNRWFGEKSQDARLTFVWEPTEKLSANLKLLVSEYENDGERYFEDTYCVDRTSQPVELALLPGSSLPSGQDCDPFDGKVQVGAMNDITASGAPSGGRQFGESELYMASLAVDYDLTDALTLTSITGLIDLKTLGTGCGSMEINCLSNGVHAINNRDSISQELRLVSNFGGKFDFAAGLYYQKRDMLFDTYQSSLDPAVVFGPDPVTGSTMSWRKVHETEAEAYSAFFSLTYRPTDDITITGGARYSEEKHENGLKIPYMHSAIESALGALPSGSIVCCAEFKDDEISPEISIMWAVRPTVNLYAAYKTGFKSGGIDNSVLPFSSLNQAALQGLAFGSETAEGFELGVKSDLLNNTLRMNATGFFYTYEDLQTQEFDVSAFNFVTLNAGELESKGIEIETIWATPWSGITATANWSYTDTKYTDDFFVTSDPAIGIENLKGTQIQGNSKWSGNLGVDYEREMTVAPLVLNAGLFANYRSKFQTGIDTQSYEQEGFWKVDARVSLASMERRWELALIGQNLTDKVTATTFVSRKPLAIPNERGFVDQGLGFSHGRQITLQVRLWLN